MAIYHLETKVVSRGTGRSAVAAAAYMSCSQILNDYDGVQHDFTRKKGLVWQQIFLPEYAPVEWQERAVLWNAVEENEKTKDSRLAREFVVALPVELNKKPWKSLLSDFINEQFVADGERISLHQGWRRTGLYCRRVQNSTGRRLGKAISVQSREKENVYDTLCRREIRI